MLDATSYLQVTEECCSRLFSKSWFHHAAGKIHMQKPIFLRRYLNSTANIAYYKNLWSVSSSLPLRFVKLIKHALFKVLVPLWFKAVDKLSSTLPFCKLANSIYIITVHFLCNLTSCCHCQMKLPFHDKQKKVPRSLQLNNSIAVFTPTQFSLNS